MSGARAYNLSYEYDNLGQLTRENNTRLGKTFVYTYDDAGNIISKKIYSYQVGTLNEDTLIETELYTYGNSAWGDQLTAYNGASITYDEIGNPLSYYNGANFSWEGRRLVGATYNGKVYSFGYDSDGLRTSKTVNGVTTNYYYLDGKLIMEETPTSLVVYCYDGMGRPMSMMYRESSYGASEWDYYTLETNLQGDVVAVYDEDGVLLTDYRYDAWGNFTATYLNGGANTTAVHNRLTYRGYYYDSDLGLYYLNSRYYDSNIGRFVSPDGAEYLGANRRLNSFNLYAYCDNNPINKFDPTGHFGIWTILGIILGIGALAATANDIYQVASGNVYVDKNETNSENVHIENSYKILTPWMRYGYSFYSNHFNSNTKDVIQGSTAGVQFEWELHNYAAWLGIGGDSAKHLDVGKSIFADGIIIIHNRQRGESRCRGEFRG